MFPKGMGLRPNEKYELASGWWKCSQQGRKSMTNPPRKVGSSCLRGGRKRRNLTPSMSMRVFLFFFFLSMIWEKKQTSFFLPHHACTTPDRPHPHSSTLILPPIFISPPSLLPAIHSKMLVD